MAIYGYARVSTEDQDLTIQQEALEKAGCEIIRAEKVSGTSTQGRDELNTLLEFLRDGDELVVTRVDHPLCNGLAGHTLRCLRMYCPKPRGGKNPLSAVKFYKYVREWCVTEPIQRVAETLRKKLARHRPLKRSMRNFLIPAPS